MESDLLALRRKCAFPFRNGRLLSSFPAPSGSLSHHRDSPPPFSVNSGNGESLLVFSRAVLRGGSVGMDDEEGPATAGATAVPAGSVCVATVCVPHTKKGSRVPLGSFCTLEFRLGTKLSFKFASNVAVRAFTRGPRPPRSVQLLLFLFRASARAKISHFPVAPTLVVAVRPFLAHPETTIGPRVPSGICAKHPS